MPLSSVATIGQLSAAFITFAFSGLNTQNQIGISPNVTSPISGKCRVLSAFVGGDGSPVNGVLAMWDTSSLSVLSKTPAFSIPSGSHANGGQTLNTQPTDGLDPMIGASAQQVLFGWERDSGGSSVWSMISGGGFISKAVSGVGAQSFSGFAFTSGDDPQAYGEILGPHAQMLYHLYGPSMRKWKRR